MHKKIILITVLFAALKVHAQDFIFSQAFMSPLYLNPAAAGSGDNDLRFTAAYKKQWLRIPGSMNYWAAAVDKYMPKIGGGVGLMASNSFEGFINKTNVSAIYSFETCITEDLEVRLGLQAGATNRRIDYSKLVFSDQLDNTGIIPGQPTESEFPYNNSKLYPDFAAGALLFYKYTYMLGLSVNHLSTPDESFTTTQESKLPRRITGTFRFMQEVGNIYLVPSAIYYTQGGNSSFSAGCELKSKYINLGVWYRGNIDFKWGDAIAVTVTLDNFLGRGLGENKLRFGVSHDATINGLGFSRTSGSTEGAFNYEVLTDEMLGAENRCRSSALDKVDCPRASFW